MLYANSLNITYNVFYKKVKIWQNKHNEVDIKIYYKYKKCIANELKAIFQVLLNLLYLCRLRISKKK